MNWWIQWFYDEFRCEPMWALCFNVMNYMLRDFDFQGRVSWNWACITSFTWIYFMQYIQIFYGFFESKVQMLMFCCERILSLKHIWAWWEIFSQIERILRDRPMLTTKRREAKQDPTSGAGSNSPKLKWFKLHLGFLQRGIWVLRY